MSASRDPDAIVRSWLDEGPAVFPDAALASALASVHATRQRRSARWLPSPGGGARFAGLATAAAAAVVVVAVVAGIGLLGGLPPIGGPGPGPSASPSPSPSPRTSPSPSPDRTPVASWPMDSARYPYTMTFPAEDVTIRPTLASVAWDGEVECLAQDPCTDWVNVTGAPGDVDRTVWAFGTETTLTLDEFAADMQRRTSSWMTCPSEPETTLDTTIDGIPARVHAMTCPYGSVSDFHLRVFAVRNGFGLVVGQAKLGSGEGVVEQAEIDRLLGYLESFRWRD